MAPTSTTIVDEVEARRDRQTLLAALDTLEYLRKGGRIGGAQALLGSMLSIKPIITVTDGEVDDGGQGSHPQQGACGSSSTACPSDGVEQHRGAARRCAGHRRVPGASSGRSWPTPRSSSATSARWSASTPARACSVSRGSSARNRPANRVTVAAWCAARRGRFGGEAADGELAAAAAAVTAARSTCCSRATSTASTRSAAASSATTRTPSTRPKRH